MKKIRMLIVAYSFIFVVTTHATVVFDPSVFARLGQEIIEMQKQAEILKHQLDALKQLGNSQYQWSNAQSLINQLGTIVKKTNAIAYSAENIESEFERNYPGYQAPEDFKQAYKNNISRSLNTLEGALHSMSVSARDFQNENNRLSFLQHQVQNAKGQTQAIQASAQIASELVSQTQLLRQTLIAQNSAQTAFYANQVQNEALAKADVDKIICAGSTETVSFGKSGHYLKIPRI